MKVSGYLEQRRKGWEAVVDVPPSKVEAVGRKRLRKGLGTRDKHVAQARLAVALLELHKEIAARTRRCPETDPLTAEAVALKVERDRIRRGDFNDWAGAPEIVETTTGEAVEVAPEAVAEGHWREHVATRAEAVRRQEGDARAAMFGAVASGRTLPFLHHAETWLAEPGTRGERRPRTVSDYRGILKEFSGWLAKERVPGVVHSITRAVAGRYVSSLHAEGLSGPRVRTILAALASYWTWLERRGGEVPEGRNPWTQQAPAKRRGGATKAEAERPFTDAEIGQLLSGPADGTLADVMRFGALSGMRIEELCRLTVGGCAGSVFDVPGTKTEAAARRVPIHPDLAGIVARRSEGKQPGDFLFDELTAQAKTGERSAAIGKRFGRYREDVGVHEKGNGRRRSRVNFHSFRRWFVTAAVRARQPEHIVAQVVGHRLAGMTLGVYHGGDTLDALRACVEAVRLPSAVTPLLTVTKAPAGTLGASTKGPQKKTR